MTRKRSREFESDEDGSPPFGDPAFDLPEPYSSALGSLIQLSDYGPRQIKIARRIGFRPPGEKEETE